MIALPICIMISCGNAFVRKLSDFGSNAFLELQWYLYSAIFLLASGSVLISDGHIRIDIFYARMSKHTQSIVNIFLHIFFTLPIIVFLIYLSVPFALSAIAPLDQIKTIGDFFHYLLIDTQYHEVSPNAGGLKTWYAKMLLPFGLILLFFATLSEIATKLTFILTHQSQKV